MHLQDVKQTIIDIGKRMYAKEWIAANNRNMNVKVAEDRVYISRTMRAFTLSEIHN